MKLKGSKMAKIECIECGVVSGQFRIWFFEEDEDLRFDLKDGDLPEGWEIEDEAELDGDLINGYCPKHKQVTK